MYLSVTIENCVENKTLPLKWLKGFRATDFVENAVNQSEKHIAFISNDENKEADFTLPISNVLIDEDACYYVRIRKFFGNSNYFINSNYCLVANANVLN